jgi:hypothetical protein
MHAKAIQLRSSTCRDTCHLHMLPLALFPHLIDCALASLPIPSCKHGLTSPRPNSNQPTMATSAALALPRVLDAAQPSRLTISAAPCDSPAMPCWPMFMFWSGRRAASSPGPEPPLWRCWACCIRAVPPCACNGRSTGACTCRRSTSLWTNRHVRDWGTCETP